MVLFEQGDSGDEIRRAQVALADLAAELRVSLPIDGEFGNAMREVLLGFQKRNDLTQTGQLDDATWKKLFPSEAPPAVDPVSPSEPSPKTPDDAATAPPERPRLHLLDDQPLATESHDRLGFDAYAEAVAGVINNPETGTPLTIAISAPWGAGKSTLAAMIRERLEKNPSAGGSKPHVTCAFNAWMHDDARNLGAAFAAEVARAAHARRPFYRRLLHPLPWALATPSERIKQLLWLAFLAVALLLAACRFLPFDWVAGLLKALGFVDEPTLAKIPTRSAGSVVLLLLPVLGKLLSNAGKSINDFVKDPETAATRGTLNRVQRQLGALIHEATPRGSRFVIFVDDLERCRPPRSVDLLEVVNQMLGHAGVVTVIMADMAAVAACAEIKYKALADRYTPADRINVPLGAASNFGRLYLQKIIQLQFDIPAHTGESIRKLVEGLIEDKEPERKSAAAARRPRVSRRVQLAWMDLKAGARAALASADSRMVWSVGLVAALLFASEFVVPSPTPPDEIWTTRAAATGLALGGWLALGLSCYRFPQLRPASPPGYSAAVTAVVIGLILIDHFLFNWGRTIVDRDGPAWLAAVIAPPATTRFWGSVGAGMFFGAMAAPLLRFMGFGETEADAERPVNDPERVARGSWILLATLEVGLLVDRVVLVHQDAFWGVFGEAVSFSYPAYGSTIVIWRTISGVALVSIAALLAVALRSWGRDARLEAARRTIDRQLAGQQPTTGVDVDEEQLQVLVEERRMLGLMNASTLLRDAYAQIRDHLHPLPRNAKRAVNRLRLLLYIAYARGAFGGTPPLKAEHLGRWIAFQERWPEIADLMPGDLSLMGKLEEYPDRRRTLLTRLPEKLRESLAVDDTLETFLAAPEHRLGLVMSRLIYFPPVAPPVGHVR